jgi:hypothetical protein
MTRIEINRPQWRQNVYIQDQIPGALCRVMAETSYGPRFSRGRGVLFGGNLGCNARKLRKGAQFSNHTREIEIWSWSIYLRLTDVGLFLSVRFSISHKIMQGVAPVYLQQLVNHLACPITTQTNSINKQIAFH